MKSKWHHLKEDTIRLRKTGMSYKAIHRKIGVPLSTLSGWLQTIPLTKEQTAILSDSWRKSNEVSRQKAAAAHRSNRFIRTLAANNSALVVLDRIKDFETKDALELALAFLYLGEGGKTRHGLRLGNSNLKILSFYVTALESLYTVSRHSLHYDLHLRQDQDVAAVRKYWSDNLSVSLEKFSYVIHDPRTKGKPTREGYYGVCLISGGGVEIQRKLMYLADTFIERSRAISSVGRALS
jgi:hypothetical protein